MKTTRFLRSGTTARISLMILLFVVLALGVTTAYADPWKDSQTGRILQVNLDEHAKVSQYSHIDSSAQAYGKNACGLVAAAAAVDIDELQEQVKLIANAAKSNYSPHKGIQPSKYVAALKKVYGDKNATEINKASIQQLYDELVKGNRVIVDVKVNVTRQIPSAVTPNYAHYARVLGIDMEKKEIYIENTLRGAAYWTVSFENFDPAWEYPETTASQIPDWRNAEDVTNWAVILDGSLAVDDEL